MATLLRTVRHRWHDQQWVAVRRTSSPLLTRVDRDARASGDRPTCRRQQRNPPDGRTGAPVRRVRAPDARTHSSAAAMIAPRSAEPMPRLRRPRARTRRRRSPIARPGVPGVASVGTRTPTPSPPATHPASQAMSCAGHLRGEANRTCASRNQDHPRRWDSTASATKLWPRCRPRRRRARPDHAVPAPSRICTASAATFVAASPPGPRGSASASASSRARCRVRRWRPRSSR